MHLLHIVLFSIVLNVCYCVVYVWVVGRIEAGTLFILEILCSVLQILPLSHCRVTGRLYLNNYSEAWKTVRPVILYLRITLQAVALGGLVASVLATGPKIRGGILKGDKVRSTTSFGREQ
jgi:uncharacterized membrane protein YagU involved in acid resistance